MTTNNNSENALTVPSHLEGKFFDYGSNRLKSRWIFYFMDKGYGVVRVRRIREEYMDKYGRLRSRYMGYQLLFDRVDDAIMFKLEVM